MGLVVDLAYALVLLVAGPFYFVSRRLKKKRLLPLRRRLGAIDAIRDGGGPVLWLHAVSVGETLALRALVAELRQRRPDARLVLTVTTVAGFEVAKKTYPDLDVRESPLDFSFAVRRFFDRIRPAALLLAELELWPNLLRQARRRRVPVLVVNARISQRSRGRYRLLARLWPGFLSPIRVFFAQSAEHMRRLESLGVGADRLVLAGNLKLDNVIWQDPAAERTRLLAAFGWDPESRVLVAGSTHPGEDEAVITAFRGLRKDVPGARLVLAPRHVERTGAILLLLESAGIAAMRWSALRRPFGAECVVVDTVGELARLYAVADVAFVGGSLVPIGGHNLLEPAVFGIPMAIGPHHWTVNDVAALFAEAGVLHVVDDPDQLAACVRDLFMDPVRVRARASTIRSVLENHRGAAARTAERVVASLTH